MMRGPRWLHRRQGRRRPGQPPRRLPDPLRAGRESSAPAWLQGSSLMPLVRGEVERLHEAIFAETTFHAAYQPQRAVRTERWKYIRRFDDYPHPSWPTATTATARTSWSRRAGASRSSPRSSSTTWSSTPPRAPTSPPTRPGRGPRGDARPPRRLDARDRDPLLDGPVPPPPGAIVNEQWQISPDEPPRIVTAGSHGRSIQLRQVQPGTSVPPGRGSRRGRRRLRPQLCEPRFQIRAAIGAANSSPSTESSRKKRMKMPWVTTSGSGPGLARSRAPPSGAAPARPGPRRSRRRAARATSGRLVRLQARAPPRPPSAVSRRPPHRAGQQAR